MSGITLSREDALLASSAIRARVADLEWRLRRNPVDVTSTKEERKRLSDLASALWEAAEIDEGAQS